MPPECERLSRQIIIPEAIDLLDAHGIRRDFVSAAAEARYLLRHLESAAQIEILIVGALTTSIIVRYCRPFAKGVRNKQIARDLLEELVSKEKQYHQRFIDWRNKHIAHSVNSFETTYLYAEWAGRSLAPSTITKVGVAETKVVGLDSSELEAIVSLTDKYVVSLDRRIAAETSRILALARRADSKAIVEKGNLRLSFPDLAAVAKPRKGNERTGG